MIVELKINTLNLEAHSFQTNKIDYKLQHDMLKKCFEFKNMKRFKELDEISEITLNDNLCEAPMKGKPA